MKKLTVKRLDVMSVANFSAMFWAAVSLVAVVLAWVIALINYTKLETYFPNIADWNTGFGIFAVVIIPLIYAAAGWVGGAVVAWFYNVALGASNGLKIEVEE